MHLVGVTWKQWDQLLVPGEPESACRCCQRACASHVYVRAWPAKSGAVSEMSFRFKYWVGY